MPVIKTKGAASSQGFGEFAKSGAATYIEDVFSTYLYTGNNSGGATPTQTITNGIDLSVKGGMTLLQCRSNDTGTAWNVYDTARGVRNYLRSNSTAGQSTAGSGAGLTTFNSNGFTLGTTWNTENFNGYTYASWTFRKQPKFFDVVTYTGTGTSSQVISHNLGSVPGCIIIKNTSGASNWRVYHVSTGATNVQFLNTTAATAADVNAWNNTSPTSTNFTVGADNNASANPFVAYIFAHDAGGFGLTGTDNVISCGGFTTDASGSVTVNLGYEPQWIMFKKTSATGNWWMFDNMRGLPTYNSSSDQVLYANLTNAETSGGATASISATGFAGLGLGASSTYIYIAIRRGSMKVPTDATKVFSPALATSNGTSATFTTNFPVDLAMFRSRASDGNSFNVMDRLRGNTPDLRTAVTDAEGSANSSFDLMTTWVDKTGYLNGTNEVLEAFRRAPGFFDEVCYTGTGANATWTHNLGVVPEMMIVKKRGGIANWAVYHSALGAAGYILLNTTAASTTSSTFWQSTTPTSTSFYTGTNGNVGDSGLTYVAYLFATCPGVSKVGAYTGTGATQTISCGFTGGARFVLVKRTDTTGDWYVWDTARGMVSGTDPSLLFNTGAAEVNANSIYTATGGFQIVSTAAGINASGGTYIYLAIA